MNATSQSPGGFASDRIQPGQWSPKSGYIVSIVIDLILLYVAQHLLDWNLPWIASTWSEVVWAVSLSLTISIVANALLLAYDQPWLRNSVEFVTIGVALLAGYWIYVVFPFDFGAEWNSLAHLVLAAVLLGLAVATVVMAVMAVLEVLRAGWRQVTQL